MLRKILNILTVALMAAVGTLYASPAQAYAGCPAAYFCQWDGFNGTGYRSQWRQVDIENIGCITFDSANNEGSSFQNRTNRSVYIHDARDCPYSGWYRRMVPGQQATAQGSDWNNRVSSLS